MKVRLLRKIGPLTDGQIAALYDLAEKAKVGIVLWQDTPSPSKAASTWAIEGGALRVWKFVREARRLLTS